MNLDLFHEPSALQTFPMQDADVRFAQMFYSSTLSTQLMAALQKEIAWRQETIVLWGKKHLQPRLSAWYGDEGCVYSYSGMRLEPLAWTSTLLRIKEDIERATEHRFNSVLCNLYRDEWDSMGWHSDGEPELGPQPVIASLSLGATRIFKFRHRHDKAVKPRSLALTDGSLVVMGGET